MRRAAESSAALWGSSGKGKVLKKHLFQLRDEYQWKGFATALYAAEDELCGRWGIDEIQLTAVDDGLEVWPRFGYLPQEPEGVKIAYRAWRRRENLSEEAFTALTACDPRFLRSLKELNLYKRLR